MGDGNFRPLQNPRPLTDHQKLVQVISWQPLRLCQIWCKSVDGEFLGKWVKYNEFFYLFIPFFMNSPTGQTRRRIFTLGGSNDADSRKGVPFGVLLILLSILGVKSPENPNFWGVNRSFQAKRAKY